MTEMNCRKWREFEIFFQLLDDYFKNWIQTLRNFYGAKKRQTDKRQIKFVLDDDYQRFDKVCALLVFRRPWTGFKEVSLFVCLCIKFFNFEEVFEANE